MEILLGEVNQGQSRVGRAFIILGESGGYMYIHRGTHRVTLGHTGWMSSVCHGHHDTKTAFISRHQIFLWVTLSSLCPACYFHPHMWDILAVEFSHFSTGCQLAAVLAQTIADAFDFCFYHLFSTSLCELTWVYPHFSSHTGTFVTVRADFAISVLFFP